MPTKNRRVATYLPKGLNDLFQSFITEHNLKSESQALIAILSEFFDVSYQTAHKVDYSAFVSQEQFKELLDKVSELSEAFEKSKASSAVNLLLGKMKRLESRMESLEGSEESRKEIKPEALPGQLDLLTDAESDLPSSSKGELPKAEQSSSRYALLRELVSKPTDEPQITEDSDSLSNSSSELQPMTGAKLSQRFGLGKQAVSNKRSVSKKEPDKFSEWLRVTDPDKVPWQYNPEDKLYHPLKTEASSQVSPLPEGSERSGEG